MNSENGKWFFNFSAAMLFLTGVAKLYSSAGTARILNIQDQLLHLGYRPLMISTGILEVSVGVFLLMNHNNLWRCLVLLFLSANFLFDHAGNYLLGIHLCPCLGHLSDRLGLPLGLPEVILQFLVLYWLLNSLIMLWRSWGSTRWERACLAVKRKLLRQSLQSTRG
jgi:hypothetical protein